MRATLKQNRDFKRLYAKGRSAVSPVVVVYCRRSPTGTGRVGFTVSTKLGGAVRRNRIRRRLREVYRLALPRLSPGWDMILVARGRTCAAPFPALQSAFQRCCRELGLWRDEP